MYARKVDDRELTFTVSGMLWKRSLVMEDEETESHWSHLLGRAMAGKLKGKRLKMIPSVMTDWKSWRAQHPKTDVLDMERTTTRFVTEVQKRPKAYTVGLRLDGTITDYTFDALRQEPVINATTKKTPYLVAYDIPSATPRVFERKVKGKTLTFERVGGRLKESRLKDRETGSIWDPVTGECTSGELSGAQLKMVACVPSFTRAWRTFYPRSETYSSEDNTTENE